jgi:hypothetical protein
MTRESSERLLNEACMLLIIFEDSNTINKKDKARIKAIFDEIKFADDIDNELALTFSEWEDKQG